MKATSLNLLLLSLAAITIMSFTGCRPTTSESTTPYSWIEIDSTLRLSHMNTVVWQYNFNSQKGKPFFHPIALNGSEITALSPEDHPWHLGLYFSWKFINSVNYWEYNQSENVPPWNYEGVTLINEKTIKRKDDFSATIKLDISYREKDLFEVLHEAQLIEVSPISEDGFFIDYTFVFEAKADTVELNRTPLAHEENGETYGGYAGLSLRFNTDLEHPVILSQEKTGLSIHGEKDNWVYYGFDRSKGEVLGAAIFDHPDNIHHPTPWHITNSPKESLYFIQPAPIFYQPLTLYKNEKLTLKYRVMFLHGEINRPALEKDWLDYAQQ